MTDPPVALEMNLSDVVRIHDAMSVLDDRDHREDLILAYLALQIAVTEKRDQLSGRGSVGTPTARGI